MRQFENVDAVYGQVDVADAEAARLGRRVRLDGRDDDRSRAVNSEAEFPADSSDSQCRVALEAPLEDLGVHDGARLAMHHAMGDGLMLLTEFSLALSRLNGGRASNRVR